MLHFISHGKTDNNAHFPVCDTVCQCSWSIPMNILFMMTSLLSNTTLSLPDMAITAFGITNGAHNTHIKENSLSMR